MKRILLIGAFDFVNHDTGGQQVKTRELYYLLKNKFEDYYTDYLETNNWKKRPFSTFIKLIKKIRRSDVIILLLAKQGIRAILPIVQAFKASKTLTYYDVIGGWLPVLVSNSPRLLKRLQKLNGIWVETSSMERSLLAFGLTHLSVLKNFKSLKRIEKSEMAYFEKAPLPVCTFSRVIAEKGITDAINAVAEINNEAKKIVYKLDIYGPIGEEFAVEFDKLIHDHSEYVCYRGIADPSQSVEIIKNYFLLLFPTHFYTEGVPGTIIDAFFSGVPVVAPAWINSEDLLRDNHNCLCYDFGDYRGFVERLKHAYRNADIVNAMKNNCAEDSTLYSAEYAAAVIKSLLEDK